MSETTPLIGEPLPIDLINTRTATADLLATPADLAAWLKRQAERHPELPTTSVGAAELSAVVALRDRFAAVARAVLHGRTPPRAALDGINTAQLAAPAIRRLRCRDGVIEARRHRSGGRAEVLTAILAAAAADLFADPSFVRLRQCEADDCVLLFVPAHPRRRWCSAGGCGNRARVARYYRRHRDN